MKAYTIVYSYPKPIYDVSGQPIKDLLEVTDTRTVKAKLDRWGISYENGYVCLDDILDAVKGKISNISTTYVSPDEDFENSTNSTSARVYDRQGDPDVPGSGVLAGIEVPEDIENMGDAIASLNLPRRFNISGVTAWNSVGL